MNRLYNQSPKEKEESLDLEHHGHRSLDLWVTQGSGGLPMTPSVLETRQKPIPAHLMPGLPCVIRTITDLHPR